MNIKDAGKESLLQKHEDILLWIGKLHETQNALLNLADVMFVKTLYEEDCHIEKAIERINIARAEIGTSISQLFLSEEENEKKLEREY